MQVDFGLAGVLQMVEERFGRLSFPAMLRSQQEYSAHRSLY